LCKAYRGAGLLKELDELKGKVNILQELGNDWKDNVAIMNNINQGNDDMTLHIRRLFKENNKSSLIKIGIACLAFPEPIVSDILGYSLLAAGLIQRRIKSSAAYLEDLNKIFPNFFKEVHQIRQETV